MAKGRARRVGAMAIVVACLAVVAVLAWDRLRGSDDDRDAVVTSGAVARQVLARLEVKDASSTTGYDRDQFGPKWSDVNRNGCDTRNDILNRDLVDRSWRPGTHGCVVIGGTLHDPYTGRTIPFSKADASAIQIDHVVALADAWQSGAQEWDSATRLRFANDPRNLLAVDGAANEAKGDADAATWLPPDRSYRCAFVERQVTVKAAYQLSVTRAERDAIARVLDACR